MEPPSNWHMPLSDYVQKRNKSDFFFIFPPQKIIPPWKHICSHSVFRQWGIRELDTWAPWPIIPDWSVRFSFKGSSILFLTNPSVAIRTLPCLNKHIAAEWKSMPLLRACISIHTLRSVVMSISETVWGVGNRDSPVFVKVGYVECPPQEKGIGELNGKVESPVFVWPRSGLKG
jgi:hypothetical protein